MADYNDFLLFCLLCVSRKNWSMEIPRGRGVSKANILETKYEAKLEFPGVGGGGEQKHSIGGV